MPLSIPAQRMGYMPAAFAGAKKAPALKRLNVRHRQIMALWLAGYNLNEISQTLDCAYATVHRVLNDETVQHHLGQVSEKTDGEIRDLIPRSIQVLRDALNNEDPKFALRAAENVLKMNGKFNDKAEESESAEDVVQRILQVESEGPVKITYGEHQGGNPSKMGGPAGMQPAEGGRSNEGAIPLVIDND